MKPLFRSTNSKLTGLCGGIADWLGLSPTIIRLIVVVAALSSFGTVLLMYFLGSMLVPKMPYSPY